jgi:mannobiose 2-epimerase
MTFSEETLTAFKKEVEKELLSILAWWKQHSIDKKRGGFYGSINNGNTPDATAVKGVVLNSRILWAFSAAYSHTGDTGDLLVATRAWEYLRDHFIDKRHGGVFWSLDSHGDIDNDRKQIYGLAFALYGLSEYYKVMEEKAVLEEAKKICNAIEQYSWDKEKGGYIDAFTREWKTLDDLRLSEKDSNEKKTMNTHLHVIEAYATFYQVWPDQSLKERIIDILDLFNRFIINSKTGHLDLYMDEDWVTKSTLQSYGHDIEAAWLLQECAEITGEKTYIDYFSQLAVKLVDTAAEGLDKDGGLWYEFEPATAHLIKEKHSWPQAEGMVGFFNAWQVTGDQKYLDHSLQTWSFIRQHIRDRKKGEWFWGVNENYSPMEMDKAGFWKCPYHNIRACLEIIRRIESGQSRKLSEPVVNG